MSAARIPFPIDAAFTDSDWAQDLVFFLNSWDNPDDFTAYASASLDGVRRYSAPVESAALTTGAGTLRLLEPNRWAFRNPRSSQATRAAGTWDWQLRLFGSDGGVVTLITFEGPIFAGMSAGGSPSGDPLGPPVGASGTLNVRRSCNGDIEVLRSGAGPMGAAGTPGAPGVIVRTANQALSGHRVIKLVGDTGADYASAEVAGDAGLIGGISAGAAGSGAAVTLRFDGEIQDVSFNWTPTAPIFCGLNGVLVQVPPAAAFIRQVAVAVSADTILVELLPPILTPEPSL